ncbi:MAG: type II secretion system F family protein, partial [Novosphingobium sp.]|nr:type II secretion system F family protein [Novosphingobium sp.]
MLQQPAGPTLLGFDVILIGTILVGLAAVSVMVAIYAAVTVKDPMAKRVKTLNARREELKAGIATTARKRASIVRKNETADKMKAILSRLKVLQDSQLQVITQKLAQAGIRKKEWAVAVIFGRMVLPVVLGTFAAIVIYWVDYFPDWGSMKKFGGFALAVGAGYKGPDIFIQNMIGKRTDAIRK